MLLSKAANIQRVRKIAAAQAASRRDARRADEKLDASRAATKHESSVLVLHGRLEEKRAASAAEKARVAGETKRIRFEQMQQAAGAAAVEANKFRELRAGAQREAVARQAAKLAEAGTYEATRSKAQQVRMQGVKQEARGRADFLREYDERLAAAAAQAAAEQLAGEQRARGMAQARREEEAAARAAHELAAYRPSGDNRGAAPTLHARLAALATGLAGGGDDVAAGGVNGGGGLGASGGLQGVAAEA